MKPSYLSNLLAPFVVLILAVVAFAAVPGTINYQGYLKDGSGVPASGPLGMTFSLYSSATPRNNPVWRENQPAVAVTSGIYSVQLGSITPITAPLDVPYYLGVQITGDPAEMPLQPLSSVPYALRASLADSVPDGSVTDAKISGVIPPSKGGTGLNTSGTAAGSLLRTTGTGTWGTLPAGTNGQVLKMTAGAPVWGTDSSNPGTVTSVTAGTGITATPSPITASGTIAIDTAVVPRLGASNIFSQDQILINSNPAKNPLTIIGAASQSNNLQEWKNNGGTTVASVSPTGVISGDGSGLSGVQKKYANVAVVAKSGGDFSDPVTAMGGVATWCGTPTASNPCLLKIMPGVYDLGSGTLTMQQYVDIEGSGELATTITSTITGEFNGTVRGAGNAELRFLTVKNNAPYTFSVWGVGVNNSSGSPKLTNISVATSVASNSCGIYNINSSPIISNVTVTATGVDNSFGIANTPATPTLTNVTTIANSATGNKYGILNNSSAPRLVNVIATATGGTNNFGMINSITTPGTFTLNIDRSTIEGSTNSILNNQTGYTLKIGASKLVGPVGPVGTYIYSGMYDGNGAVTAAAFSGNGSGLTNVAATTVSNGVYTTGSYANPDWITSLAGSKIVGPIADAKLTANVALLDTSQTFSNSKTFTDSGLLLRNSSTTFSTTLRAPNATTARTVTLPDASGTVITTGNLSGITSVGTITSGTWNSTTISLAYGGTGATTATEALTKLGAVAKSGGDMTGALNVPLVGLPATTNSTTGVITSDGNRLIHSFGALNFFAGVNAGNFTMSGTGANVGVGVASLQANTTGYNNTAVGTNALFLNQDGFRNTAVGVLALHNNVSGDSNTALGTNALQITTGSANTAVGDLALRFNTSGGTNTALGYYAGGAASNMTGIRNTFIGANSGPGSENGLVNATAIGSNAQVTQSNSLVLGGTGADAVKVGIGTTAPGTYLDVTDMMRVLGTTSTAWPTSGEGLEMKYRSDLNKGYIQAYDRNTSAWGTLDLNASTVTVGGFLQVNGAQQVTGYLDVLGFISKGGGSFKIDHPLDPRNKYLYHSFVESPDMMNIYNGNVTTDDRGYATVELPEWFEALNREFRYQLTVIDEGDTGSFVQAKVVKGVSGNRFTVRTSMPATTVSWQVTGIRKDAFAEQNRIKVEVEKYDGEKGTCLYPEACK